MKPFHFQLGYRNNRFFPIQILIFLRLDNKADAHISSLGYLCVNLHAFNTWYTCMVEKGCKIKDGSYRQEILNIMAVYTIFTSAMSKSTSFWRKISICSLNFSFTTFCPAPLEYSEAVWQIDPAKSAPPSWATPLARSHAAWFILVVWNKIFKKAGQMLFILILEIVQKRWILHFFGKNFKTVLYKRTYLIKCGCLVFMICVFWGAQQHRIAIKTK